MRLLRKLLVILLVVFAVLFLTILLMSRKADKVMLAIKSAYNEIQPLKISTIPDGIYLGSAGGIPVKVTLEVIVTGQAMTNINILGQLSGKGYEARETLQRILARQQPKVDVVTGATLSSKCLMIAVNKALLSANRE